ncbi:phage terminase large subunit family protein, partial [Xanthomonas campestris]
VEFGVNWMLTRMENGDLKVFNTCTNFLKEMKMYHRKDGKIVDRNDDMISATRYALLMASRHARPGAVRNSGYYRSDTARLIPDWFGSIV